jgi:diacylglycerol kinase (ATP)
MTSTTQKTDPDATPPSHPKPPRVTGLAHVFAAGGYSLQGVRRLWQETAFRHITLLLPLAIAVFAAVGAQLGDYAILMVLFLILVATEALNTAVECIVDHLAPDWQVFARDAKDLGSLATLCLLAANGVFISAVVYRSIAIG